MNFYTSCAQECSPETESARAVQHTFPGSQGWVQTLIPLTRQGLYSYKNRNELQTAHGTHRLKEAGAPIAEIRNETIYWGCVTIDGVSIY